MCLPQGTLLHSKYRIVEKKSASNEIITYTGTDMVTGEPIYVNEYFDADICKRDRENVSVSNGDVNRFAEGKRRFMQLASSLGMLPDRRNKVVYDIFQDKGTAYFVEKECISSQEVKSFSSVPLPCIDNDELQDEIEEDRRNSRRRHIAFAIGVLFILILSFCILFTIPYENNDFPTRNSQELAEVKVASSESEDANDQVVKLRKRDNVTTFMVKGVPFDMVAIPQGEFEMGANENQKSTSYSFEHPVHKVVLNPFMISTTEVTQKLWKEVMGSNPSCVQGDDLPVENVSWYDCMQFIESLNNLTGLIFRLPTEAEWEYAARGGDESTLNHIYSGSNNISEVGWYNGNSHQRHHAVGSLKPNALGLYDMSGNVMEWCSDWLGAYPDSITVAPTGPRNGKYRIYRGGSWMQNPVYNRTSHRDGASPTEHHSALGLRLAM